MCPANTPVFSQNWIYVLFIHSFVQRRISFVQPLQPTKPLKEFCVHFLRILVCNQLEGLGAVDS